MTNKTAKHFVSHEGRVWQFTDRGFARFKAAIKTDASEAQMSKFGKVVCTGMVSFDNMKQDALYAE